MMRRRWWGSSVEAFRADEALLADAVTHSDAPEVPPRIASVTLDQGIVRLNTACLTRVHFVVEIDRFASIF